MSAPQDDAGLVEVRGKWLLPVGDGKVTQLTAKPRKTDSIRNCIEQGIIAPAPVRLAGNVRAWPVAEANAIIAAAGAERILSKPRRPVSEAGFSLLAWEARTARQMRGDGEAEAK